MPTPYNVGETLDQCSACSGDVVAEWTPTMGRCRECGAVQGSCYRGEASQWVRLGAPMLPNSDDLRYFDLVVLGSDGVSRVHGWADRGSRRVVQYG
jgi:hypothetical protein